MATHPKKQHGQLTVVIKLGTSSIVDEKTHQPLLSILSLIVETSVKLHQDGHRVVIVSSGAIGVGLRRMGLNKRPKHLPKIQALAAIGQCRLMSLWDQLFGLVQQPIAQVLLTRTDIADRIRYQNAQNTFFELLNMGVIPIVNENDTLVVTEIKFGDNDTLSAITAGMVQADYLFLMTDVDCLYDKNPRTNPDATAITVVEDIGDVEADVSSAGSALGTGGMSTKIVAARLATSAGVTTVITKSSKPGNISAIIRDAEAQKLSRKASRESAGSFYGEGILLPQTGALNIHGAGQPPGTSSTSTPQESPSGTPLKQPEMVEVPLHTRFLPIAHPIRDRWFWILHGLTPHGTVYIDQGAYHALSDKAGLLPVGIVDVDGHFAQQEAVRLVVVKRLLSNNSAATSVSSSYQSITNHPIPDRNALYERAHPALIHSTSSSHNDHTVAYELHNPAPYEIGRAVVNYSAVELRRIKGLHSTQIRQALGYADSEYVAMRENVAFFDVERSRPTTPSLGRGTSDHGEPH